MPLRKIVPFWHTFPIITKDKTKRCVNTAEVIAQEHKQNCVYKDGCFKILYTGKWIPC
jgi:hypothetical protein